MLIKSILSDAVASFPQNSWPTYDGHLLDRTEFLTSSEVAGCLRKAFFAKNADKYPHQTFDANGYTERGHAVEAWLVERFRFIAPLRGYKFEYLGDDQRSFYDPELGLSGTPDGLLTMPDGELILLEFKSYDPRKNTRTFPLEKHRFQCVQNMYLVNTCLDLISQGKAIKRAFILYVNASDFFEQHEFEVPFDQAMLETCIERADDLWNAERPEDVKPEGLTTGDCEYCKATHHCSAAIPLDKAMEVAKQSAGNFSLPLAGESESKGGLEDDELAALAEFIELKEVASQADKLLDVQKKALHSIFEKVGPIINLPDGRTLTRELVPGRETLDKKLLIDAGYELDNFMKVGAPYAQFSFSRNKPNGINAAEAIRSLIAGPVEEPIPLSGETELPQIADTPADAPVVAPVIPKPRRSKTFNK